MEGNSSFLDFVPYKAKPDDNLQPQKSSELPWRYLAEVKHNLTKVLMVKDRNQQRLNKAFDYHCTF